MNKKAEKNQRIQVFARCRPLNSNEKKQFSPSIVEVIPNDNQILVKDRHTNREFKFDRFDKVFSPDAKQISVYKAVVEPLIKEVLMGYNCTVFAYGQTGTGKTYTMEGERNDSNCSWENDPGAGIIPRSIHQLFEELDKGPKTEFSVRVSFLELYNEELFDLLSSHELSRLRLFEDSSKKGSVIIQGLEEIVVNRKAEVYSILEKGAARRQTAATLINASSSRSHTVFSVTVHIKETTDDGEDLLKTGKLNLVDLAGSENVGRSGAVDKRAREAGNINQSLLTLGRVITALIDKQPHIPYRESKLTRLLQDSLGGRTKTSIIATVSPALCNFDETISTLDYATKAQKITIKPEINQKMTKRALIREYTEEIERLRKDLVAVRSKDGFYIDSENYANLLNEMSAKTELIKEYAEKIDFLNEEKAKIEDLFKLTKEELIVVSKKRNEISQKYKRTAADLSSATNALNQTKQVLSETALERDERQFLLNIQCNTEKTLSKQAQMLLHVATETTDDIEKLHGKIDRKNCIEKTNEEKCQEFKVNLPKQLAQLDDIVSHSEKQQASVLSDIREELDELLQSIQNTKQKNYDFSNQLLSVIEFHFKNILTSLTSESELHTKWTNSFLENFEYQKKNLSDKLNYLILEIHPKLIQERNLMNSEVENWFTEKQTQLSQKIEEQKHALIYNSECRRKVLNSVRESFNDLCKNYEMLASNFEQNLTAMTEQEHIFEKVFNEQWTILKEKRQNVALQKLEFRNAVLQSQSMNSSLDALLKTQDILEENVSTFNEFSSLLNNSHKEGFSLMQEKMQQSQQKTTEELEKFATDLKEDQNTVFSEAAATIEKHLSSTIENEQSNKKHISEMKLSIMDYVETEKHSFNDQLIHNEKNIQNTKDKIKKAESLNNSTTNKVKCNLLKIDTECEKFISEDLQKDVPTGITPQRKNYYYPRILAATSPHERILQRYRSQLRADTAVAVNLPLNSSFSELDELKENIASINNGNETTSVHNLSFTSDESNTCETDSCHSSMSDLSTESSRSKENKICHKKASRLPKKVKCKTFVKPTHPSLRKPLVTSNLATAQEYDV